MSGGGGGEITDLAFNPDKVKVAIKQRLGLSVELADREYWRRVIGSEASVQ